MKVDLARNIAAALAQAVKDADASGAQDISIADVLRGADDAAREELEQAIDASVQQTPPGVPPQP